MNDAPALRRADVGVSMGRSGTEAAREASDIVLTDDDFSTIVAAIREGRAITENVRKFVAFLLSANLGEVLLFASSVLAGLGRADDRRAGARGERAHRWSHRPSPCRPIHPPPMRCNGRRNAATSCSGVNHGLRSGSSASSSESPRWVRSWPARALDREASQTVAFATIALSELLVVFAVRSPLEAAWRAPRNGYLLAAVAASVLLLALTIYLPGLQDPFGTVALEIRELAVVLGFSLVPFVVVELVKALLRRFAPAWAASALRTTRQAPASERSGAVL